MSSSWAEFVAWCAAHPESAATAIVVLALLWIVK